MHTDQEMGRTISADVETDSTQRSGCALERVLARQDTSKFDGCGSKTPFVTKSCVSEGH